MNKTPPHKLLTNKRFRLRRKNRVFDDVVKYKLKMGCADCGYNDHPDALQFDHLPQFDKHKCVSSLIGYRSEKRVWEEIAKCEVVCANCHAIRTSARRRLNSEGD